MSNGYNFTERGRKVLAMSREEAYALNLEYERGVGYQVSREYVMEVPLLPAEATGYLTGTALDIDGGLDDEMGVS